MVSGRDRRVLIEIDDSDDDSNGKTKAHKGKSDRRQATLTRRGRQCRFWNQGLDVCGRVFGLSPESQPKMRAPL